jgi:glycine/D-amino acid oxidase-like deaminating enzyme
MAPVSCDVDYLVIGGGFYGCCLALYLRSTSRRVMLIEAGDRLMTRASRVNQARIHTGFHYPRSALTAVRSKVLHQRFIQDFPAAVVDDFHMLYAVSRRRSKVTSKRFFRMFRDVGAPIEPAAPTRAALFDESMIEEVFSCREAAFDYTVLRDFMEQRLDGAGVALRLGTAVTAIEERAEHVVAGLSNGRDVTARHAFNVTYAQINSLLDMAGLPRANLKHELAEIALVIPPSELEGIGVTVMDGPFFSCMPYPAESLHSLTHVRYTPHASWTDDSCPRDPYSHFASRNPQTRVAHMIRDAKRFLPCLTNARHVHSIYDVKTVLVKNEHDDGRPILYQRKPASSGITSILGGKIDNVYDLFDLVRQTIPELASATDALVMAR